MYEKIQVYYFGNCDDEVIVTIINRMKHSNNDNMRNDADISHTEH